MKSKIKITYINKNYKLFKLNYILINLDSLLSKIKIYYNKECEFGQNIKIIHFKNITFNKNIDFSCLNHNTLIILDNCYFNCKNIYLENGNYQIINPKFYDKNKTKLDIRFCKNVEIVSNSDSIIDLIHISNSNNINLNLFNDINKLILYGNSITLKNFKKVKEYYIRSEKLNEINCEIDYSNLSQNQILIGDINKKENIKIKQKR